MIAQWRSPLTFYCPPEKMGGSFYKALFLKNAIFVKNRENSTSKRFSTFLSIQMAQNMFLENFRSSFGKNNQYYGIFRQNVTILNIMVS